MEGDIPVEEAQKEVDVKPPEDFLQKSFDKVLPPPIIVKKRHYTYNPDNRSPYVFFVKKVKRLFVIQGLQMSIEKEAKDALDRKIRQLIKDAMMRALSNNRTRIREYDI